MSSITVVKALPLGKGITLHIKRNEGEPEDSLGRNYVEVVANGDEGDDLVEVPPHWHKHHSERMTVLEGRVQVTLNGQTTILRAGDPSMVIPRRAVHSFKGFKGERLVVREQADPPGDYKAKFFNDLLSNGGLRNGPHVLRAFYDGDTYAALPLYFQFLDEVFITIVGGIAKLFTAPKPKTL